MVLVGVEVKQRPYKDQATGTQKVSNKLWLYFEDTEKLDNGEEFGLGCRTKSYSIKNDHDTLNSVFKGIYEESGTAWIEKLIGVDLDLVTTYSSYGEQLKRVLL